MNGNGRAVVTVETDPVSAPLPEGVFHLLAADDDLACPYGDLVAVCGEVGARLPCRPRASAWGRVRPQPLVLPGVRALGCPLERQRRPRIWGPPVTGLAPVIAPEVTCPACRSDEAIRRTSCTPLVEAWACDRCNSRWAITVVNPEPALLDRIATAMAARSTADEVITVAQTARDGDSEPRGYFVGKCGHPVPLVGPICYVGPCGDCESDDT